MVAHIHRDDFLVLNQQFQRDAAGQIDRYRMQAFVLAAQRVQAQRGMGRIGLQQLQGFQVVLAHRRSVSQARRAIAIASVKPFAIY